VEEALLFLEIISANENEKFEVHWVEIESPSGSFLVGPNHSPLISIIKKNSVVIYKKGDGEEVSINVYGGLFNMSGHNRAVVLLER
jgi:F0F1-type ATP synthase epsilon subunit